MEESRDELVGGNGEIAEFRHVLNPLFPLVFLDERQQRLPTPGHVAQLCTLVHAYVTKLRPVFLLFGREGLLRVLLVFVGTLAFGASSGTGVSPMAISSCARNAWSQARTRPMASSIVVVLPPIMALPMACDNPSTPFTTVLNAPRSCSKRMSM